MDEERNARKREFVEQVAGIVRREPDKYRRLLARDWASLDPAEREQLRLVATAFVHAVVEDLIQ